MLDTLLVALVISVDTAQVKEFPQKAEVEFKKNDLKENIIKSALNFHNSGKKDDKTWNWKIQDVVFKKDYVRHIIGCAGYLGRYRAGKGISAEGGSRV